MESRANAVSLIGLTLLVVGIVVFAPKRQDVTVPREVVQKPTPEDVAAFKEVFKVDPKDPKAEAVVLKRLWELNDAMPSISQFPAGNDGTMQYLNDPRVKKFLKAHDLAKKCGFDPNRAYDPRLRAAENLMKETELILKRVTELGTSLPVQTTGQEILEEWRKKQEKEKLRR